jgi:hypothetical protein
MEGMSLREFLSLARETLLKTGRPWSGKRRGRPQFDPLTRIMALLVKERYGFTYRETEVYLNENRETTIESGMVAIPDHNTIWRTMKKLRQPYLKQLNREVNSLFKKLRSKSQWTQQASALKCTIHGGETSQDGSILSFTPP